MFMGRSEIQQGLDLESVYPDGGAGISAHAAGINYAIPCTNSLAIIN